MTPDESTEVIAEARWLEAKKDIDGAGRAYLRCLEYCVRDERAVGIDLARIAGASAEFQSATWTAVARIESRLIDPASTGDAGDDLEAYISVCSAWRDGARLAYLLDVLRQRGLYERRRQALKTMATWVPTLLASLSEEDAASFVEFARLAPAEDAALAKQLHMRPVDVALLEEDRITRAFALTTALLTSKKRERATELLRLLVSGTPQSSCAEVKRVAERMLRTGELHALVLEVCPP